MVVATRPAVDGGLTMAAPSAVFTIGRVAAMLASRKRYAALTEGMLNSAFSVAPAVSPTIKNTPERMFWGVN
jgi:hypothetical protein